MKLVLAAVGRMKAGPERELADRYADRAQKLGRNLGLTGPAIIELPESRARSADQRKLEEAGDLLARIGDTTLIAFDERGQSMKSEAFARLLSGGLEASVAGTAFVIGGADGLHEDVRQRAKHLLSFGKMTMPHQLVRVLALEQIYRATTILSNHPYHRQ